MVQIYILCTLVKEKPCCGILSNKLDWQLRALFSLMKQMPLLPEGMSDLQNLINNVPKGLEFVTEVDANNQAAGPS